jgi:folate-binding Fe-S cluster repair protein YgfZ
VDCLVTEAPAEDGGGFFLDCPRALAMTFAARLNFYKLRAKVTVEDLSEKLGVMAVWGGTGINQDRSTEYGDVIGDMKKAYATDEIIEVDGKKQLVAAGAIATIAYDPADGKEIWKFRHGWMNAGCRPRFHDGVLFLSAGNEKNALVALKLAGRTGELGDGDVLWRTNKAPPQKPSPIYWNGMLFTVADNIKDY